MEVVWNKLEIESTAALFSFRYMYRADTPFDFWFPIWSGKEFPLLSRIISLFFFVDQNRVGSCSYKELIVNLTPTAIHLLYSHEFTVLNIFPIFLIKKSYPDKHEKAGNTAFGVKKKEFDV